MIDTFYLQVQGELAVSKLIEEALNILRHVFQEIEIARHTFFHSLTDGRETIAFGDNLSYLWLNMGQDIKFRVELFSYALNSGQGLDQKDKVTWAVDLITLEHCQKF